MDLLREDFNIDDYSEPLSPPGLLSHFEGFPVYEEFFLKNSSENLSKPVDQQNLQNLAAQRVSAEKALEHLLTKVLGDDLPGKEHLAIYLRHQYRHNCRPSTLRNTQMTGESFLRFLGDEGKIRLEQMTKWDMESFIEQEQDRGLKPSSVRTRFV